jgi:hypothetical protein
MASTLFLIARAMSSLLFFGVMVHMPEVYAFGAEPSKPFCVRRCSKKEMEGNRMLLPDKNTGRRITMNGILLMLAASFLLVGCSVLGKREAAEPPYTVLLKEGDCEVRQYGEMVVAETVVEGEYSRTSGTAFSRLAGYIFGKNRKKETISMTAPVIQEPVSEKLPMTAPVLQERKGKAWVMAFVMPEGSTLASLPEPLDPAVTLRALPGKKVAVIRYSGLHSESNLRAFSEKLGVWLAEKGFSPLSQPRAASYDPPWTIPFLRRNEVHIDVE